MTACSLQPAEVPFPDGETGVTVPVTTPFKFGQPRPFEYTSVSPDSIRESAPVHFDLDKLPAKSFTINDFKPLTDTIQQVNFDWDKLPDSVININEMTERPFRFQQSVLPSPVVVKAGMPKLMSNTSSGVLQFSVEEGLPGMAISASLTDRSGCTWLATEKGLCRYTGDYLYIYSFVNKTPQGGDYTISQMTLDNNGNIWLVTMGDGIYMIDTHNNMLLHNKDPFFSTRVLCDHTGLLWVTTLADGIFIIDSKKETIKNITRAGGENYGNRITAIREDSHNNIWLGYVDHVAVLDVQRKSIKKLTKELGFSNNVVLSFCEDWRGDMWIATYGEGIQVISFKNKTLGTLNKRNGFYGPAVELLEDSQQRLWILRRDTSYILNRERNALKKVLVDAVMTQANIRGSSLIDMHGNIWMGTINRGVVILDTKGPLPETLDTKNGLADNNVWGLLEDEKGLIWLATRQGINIYDPRYNQLKLFSADQGLGVIATGRVDSDSQGNIFVTTVKGFSMVSPRQKTLVNYEIKQGNSNFYISECLADSAGRLWLISYNGLYVYDIGKKWLQLVDKQAGLLSNVTWDLLQDGQGNIWAASDSGITIINTRKNTMQYLRKKDGLCNNVVFKLIQRPGGKMWVGTLTGISIIDMNNFSITNLTRKEGLVPEDVYDMVEHGGTVYAGTSSGMIAVNEAAPGDTGKSWHIANYGKREGFRYNDFNQNTGIALKNGQLWWGITPVLTVITQLPLPDTLRPAINITGMNIMDQSFSFSSGTAEDDGIKATGSIGSKANKGNERENKLTADSGYLQQHHISWDSVTGGFNIPAGLNLPYNQNAVNFSFSNTNISGRERILYRYILEGIDKKWSDISDRNNTKNYFNLPAGKYTFRVRTIGLNRSWSQEAVCSFIITPPWWKTWWAYILYVLVAAAIATAYANYRSYQLRKENLALESKISQRTGELSKSLNDLKATQTQLIQSEKMASLGELTAGIAHEIQNPLNFVNNFSEVSNELMDEMNAEIARGDMDEARAIANDIKQNLEKIAQHGKRADAIVKGMLQHSRTSAGQKEATDINALADEYLRLAYHGLRAKDKDFNAILKTEFDPLIKKVTIIPQDMGRVLLNLFTNAFYTITEKKKQQQYADYAPMVTVKTLLLPGFGEGPGQVQIIIADNGSGIPQKILDKIFQPFFTTKPTGQGTGLGLSLAYDIVKAHRGELTVKTAEGKGTEFTIQLPVA
ncbi:MAG: two-component regulator propeller domain-containing protein [Chitinophagaceae bacterium]